MSSMAVHHHAHCTILWAGSCDILESVCAVRLLLSYGLYGSCGKRGFKAAKVHKE